jgi:hypothetical protein
MTFGREPYIMAAKTSNDFALSGAVDESAVRKLQKQVSDISGVVNSLVDKTVNEYCEDLDNYVDYIRNCLSDDANPVTDTELDSFVLNLPVLLYFTGNAQETLGVRDDVSHAVRMELYNTVYSNSAGTIADKSAAADLATQAEYICNTVYSRAYKKIKLRMEIANELLQSVKKVVSRRMAEYELTRVAPQRSGGSK